MSRSNSPLIESLENRRLLSAGAFVVGSMLRVQGAPLSPNTIAVDDNGASITVSVNWTTARGVAKSFSSSFLKSLGFTEVWVRGGIKADVITVGKNSASFTLPTRIDGIAGNDSITTAGLQNDTVFGGIGADTITTGDGNDIVHGGLRSDVITVGNGNDRVKGGILADTITAGNGNDTVVGGAGPDLITVGNGNDLVFGERGNDTITAGNGNDTLWGGPGDDSIKAGNGTDTFGGILGINTLLGGTGHDTFVVRSLAGQTTSYNPAKDTLRIVKREDKSPKI